jgi:hypothetical protein
MENVKGAGNLLADESNEIFTPYQQRSPLFTFGEASDVSTGTGVFVWRSEMNEETIRDLKAFWRQPVDIDVAAYYWQPGSGIAFCVSDQMRFDHIAKAFEKKHGHCYCYIAGDAPKYCRDMMLMVEMMQSIIRDGVDPKSVGAAITQVWHDILSEDTWHVVCNKFGI